MKVIIPALNYALASAAPANGAAAVVSGWGTTSSGGSIPAQLRYVNLKIVGRSQCSSSTYGYGSKIKSSMICAYTVVRIRVR
ncbi:Trypsin alpha-3 [Lucilia cuprina]|nr:Trypsin alpha-3 [Lucilia cuprina]